MAHSWEPSNVPLEQPKPRAWVGFRGWLGVVARMPIGIPLRLTSVACMCLAIFGGLLARSKPAPEEFIVSAPESLSSAPLKAGQARGAPSRELTIVLSPHSLVAPIAKGGLAPRWIPSLDPVDVCKAIKVGETSSPWAKSLVISGEWECFSAYDAYAPGKKRRAKLSVDGDVTPAEKASLFAMARGTRKTGVGYIRLKISAMDEKGAEAGVAIAVDRLRAIFEMLKLTLPERAALSMRLLEPFDMNEAGLDIRFSIEVMKDWRYNLVLTFPKETTVTLSADYRDLPLAVCDGPFKCVDFSGQNCKATIP